jgi:hypothetical protein
MSSNFDRAQARYDAQAPGDDLTECLVEIIRETEEAILVSDSEVEAWLPLSQIEIIEDRGAGVVLLELPIWLAREKDLI